MAKASSLPGSQSSHIGTCISGIGSNKCILDSQRRGESKGLYIRIIRCGTENANQLRKTGSQFCGMDIGKCKWGFLPAISDSMIT